MAAERLASEHDDVTIGSMGALFTQRPGEMRELRSSQVVCIDGCATKCASSLADARGIKDASVISTPEVSSTTGNEDEKVQSVVNAVRNVFLHADVGDVSAQIPEEEAGSEFLQEAFDKFTLRVKKGLRYSDNDFWAKVENGFVRIGVSDFLQQMMSDVYYIRLVEVGTRVQMFDEAGAMESTKTLLEIIVPVSGTIVERNIMLEDSPELVNEDPYERGWLYVVTPDDTTELELLKDASEYMTYALSKAKKEIGNKVKE
jgi:glycine cleavage system H protein